MVHWLICSMTCGNLVPQSGTEPAYPALQGGFLTTAQPEKSHDKSFPCTFLFLCLLYNHLVGTATTIIPVLLKLQFSSVAQSCLTLCDPMNCSTPGLPSITNSWSSLKLMSIESVMPSSHLMFCRPLLLLPSIFPSIRGFSNQSILHIRWPKYWSFSFGISCSNEHSGLISFRVDWISNLAVQGAIKSLLQHHCSKASILWCLAFFMVKLSHPFITTGKTTALTIRTFDGKVMSLLFNVLSSFVITFLPRSQCLLIPWLQSPSTVKLRPKKIKSVTASTFPHLVP